MKSQGVLGALAALLAGVPLCLSISVKLDGDLINISGNQAGGYPRALQVKDGTLLATYPSPNNGIVVRASHDAGATWGAPATVLASHEQTDENNPFLFQKASGDILCAYRRHVKDNGTITQLNLDVSQSKDGEKTWSFLSSIISEKPTDTIKGEWEPFLLHNEVNDKLEVYWAHEMWKPTGTKNTDQDTVKKISPDGGKTWGPMLTMTGADLQQRDGMPNIAALDDSGKNLMLVYETNEGTAQLKVWAQTSSDGGANWGNRKMIFGPGNTYAGGPGIVNFNGTLVVSFMTNQDAPANDPNRKDMKVITSTNKGQDWSGPTTAMKNGSWGGIAVVDDGMIIVAAHDNHAYGQKVRLVN